MKKLILVTMMIGLIGCGHSDSGAPATPATWAQHDQNSLLLGCTSTAEAAIPSGTSASQLPTVHTIIDIYCNCMLTETMKRWSAADFSANSAADSQVLLTDGTSSQCEANAAM